NKVKDKLRSYAVTSGGKELIDALSPYNSIYEVENKLEETNEALDILIKKGAPPFEGLHETKEELERSKKDPFFNLAVGSDKREEDSSKHLIFDYKGIQYALMAGDDMDVNEFYKMAEEIIK
ncbi:MAG: hypothetical protein E6644_01155, partial [Peptoniphilus harei]|nr:hypothetical protein [Peptoniphilus harei]